MSFAVISDEYGDPDQVKTLYQGTEHTDTHNMWLSLALRYLFAPKLRLFSSKLHLVQNLFKGCDYSHPKFYPLYLLTWD